MSETLACWGFLTTGYIACGSLQDALQDMLRLIAGLQIAIALKVAALLHGSSGVGLHHPILTSWPSLLKQDPAPCLLQPGPISVAIRLSSGMHSYSSSVLCSTGSASMLWADEDWGLSSVCLQGLEQGSMTMHRSVLEEIQAAPASPM